MLILFIFGKISSMREHDNFKYTCLFGGGAIRGAAHVGVLRAFNEIGIIPTTLAGSSVGSMVAALYAVGYTVDELADVFLSVNFELFRDISFGFSNKFALSKGEVFLEWMRDLIERKFYGDEYRKGKSKHVTFNDLNRNLIIISTNMKDCVSREFSNFETPDFEVALAVRISCCMPGLMKPLTYEEDLLVDGDLMKGMPMWYLSKNLQNTKDRLLEIRLEGTYADSDLTPIDYVNGMYTCITSTETKFIKSLYKECDKYDYLVINTGDVVVVDFNYPAQKRQAIMQDGYDQTILYFKNELLQKKKNISNIYSEILDKLRMTQEFMLRKDFMAAKYTVSELFVFMFKHKNVIDVELLDAISMFYKFFASNIKVGLFGHSSCYNAPAVREALLSIISDLDNRIDQINLYLTKFSV